MNKHESKRGGIGLKRLVVSVCRITVFAYLGTVLYSCLVSETMIFQPQPSSYQDSDQIIKLDSGNGEAVSAIYLRNPNAFYTILYSHGNAEDIGHLLPMLEEIKGMGFSLFAYDYRGYGTSLGTPSEKKVYEDEETAYDYLVNNLGIPACRIIALGRSLGGAVAIDLAHKRQLGGLIIESSFVTAYRVLTRIPLLPFDKFKNISKMKKVSCQVLVIHGKQDEVVPFWHGERLFEEANEPRLSFWVEGAGHNNLFEAAGSDYRKVLRDFVTIVEKGSKNMP